MRWPFRLNTRESSCALYLSTMPSSSSSISGSPTPRFGRCITTRFGPRRSTGSGGTRTSRSTTAMRVLSPKPPRREQLSGCTTTSCSWFRRCSGHCGQICASASSCTSPSHHRSCSCSCHGGDRYSKGFWAPTWWGSRCRGRRRISRGSLDESWAHRVPTPC